MDILGIGNYKAPGDETTVPLERLTALERASQLQGHIPVRI